MRFDLPKKFSASFQREILEKSENNAKFYIGLVFIAIVLFVILGIRPLALTAAENRNVLLELGKINTLLKQKVQDLKTGAQQMNDYSDQIDILYTKMPENVYLEEYLKEVVLASAKAGFVIQRFRQQDATEGKIPIEIELNGEISNLPRLVKALEGTSRFTVVRSIRTNAEENYTDVRVLVEIYKL
jgi:Tfp pilus assembly protein PilO